MNPSRFIYYTFVLLPAYYYMVYFYYQTHYTIGSEAEHGAINLLNKTGCNITGVSQVYIIKEGERMILFFVFSNETDQNKFEYLYSKYKNLLLHKAYGILGDYALAEDAVSEAYIRIFNNIHKIGDPAANRSIVFIVTIVKNVSLTILSKEKKAHAAELDDTLPDSFDLEESVLDAISSAQIYALMEQMSEELRSVFLFYYAYEYSLKEIGTLLGISENNAAVRLHRARKKLAELMVREGYVHAG